METTDEKLKFALNFYRWSLEQWTAEIEGGFPLLRAIRNDTAEESLQVLEKLSLDECRMVTKALAKRFHPAAAKTLGEPISEQEQQLIESFDQARRREYTQADWSGLKRKSSPRQTPQREIRALLRKQIGPALEPILGKDRKKLGGGNTQYRTAIRRFTIATFLDLGGRTDLVYDHAVWSESAGLSPKVDPLGWLGIGGTSWDLLYRISVLSSY